MSKVDMANEMWRGLSSCIRADRSVALTTVSHWLEHHGAGYPEVPFLPEKIRDDARFWSLCAVQHELEAYIAAAITALDRSELTDRQSKRLAAASWKQMTPTSKEAFREWINKND